METSTKPISLTLLALSAAASTCNTPPAARADEVPTPTVLELGASTMHVNVMKNAMPKMPSFVPLSPQKGKVRGFVKDLKGKPLANARIGIRATLVGGSYSGAQGKTDVKGYYEISVPYGACEFYNAGYSIDYGEGRAAVGLHPADGEADSFASENGAVENFVLLPYGIADRDGAQDKPGYSGNYYGGTLSISYYVAEGSIFDLPYYLPGDSTIELTLTPQEPLIDGSKGRAFTIRKKVGSGFTIVNIPITTYRLSARVADGTPLKMEEGGPNGGSAFGIEPKEATGSCTLLLRPGSAKAERARQAHGNWDTISITVKR